MPASPFAVESKNHLITTWAGLVRDRGGQISVDDGVSRIWADSTFGFWNAVTLNGTDIAADALGDQLSRAASFMSGRSRAGYLWVFEELLSPQARQDLLALADKSGLELAFSGRGMAGDVPVPEPHHPELEFRRVATDDDLAAYGHLNALAYGMSPEAGRAALAGSALWRREAYAFIALRDGVPVSCAATIGTDDALFLALVATDPAQTRRGYGAAVTRKAIHEGFAQTGKSRVVLHATQAGQPVYERMGYRPNTPIHFFQLAI